MTCKPRRFMHACKPCGSNAVSDCRMKWRRVAVFGLQWPSCLVSATPIRTPTTLLARLTPHAFGVFKQVPQSSNMDLRTARRVKSEKRRFVNVGADSGSAPPRRREHARVKRPRRWAGAARGLGFRVWEFGVYIPVEYQNCSRRCTAGAPGCRGLAKQRYDEHRRCARAWSGATSFRTHTTHLPSLKTRASGVLYAGPQSWGMDLRTAWWKVSGATSKT